MKIFVQAGGTPLTEEEIKEITALLVKLGYVVLENQEQCMRQYLEVLETRAEYENIDLYGEETAKK